MTTRLSTRTISTEAIEQTLRNEINLLIDDNTLTEIGNLFAKTINPWVPFLEGPLSQTVNITPHYIEYIVPYATRQYFGDGFNFTKDYHPLACAHWDEVAMQTEMDSFLQQVEQILRRRANELYG